MLCPVDDRVRDARKLCNLDAVAVVGSARNDFPQKDEFPVLLLRRDVVIADAVELPFKNGERVDAAEALQEFKRNIPAGYYLRPIPQDQLDGLMMSTEEKAAYQNPAYRN